ncbi:hypothetical protein [Streptomyces gobiensis]|uniref:hypothetical protein n=1 Tax=Streptomyces gobiensis TaxID=2875706 RepID=UPI001E54CAED|nr:hypothetical protein [Streptomyces gobiensis]UGY92373.1 hypothetical protein test1122_11975 [Streptomyces gobiensis]
MTTGKDDRPGPGEEPENARPENAGPAHTDPAHTASADEALRRLMRDVVSDIEPAPDSLEHIRRAVPARRARRRQALIGVATAVLLVGVTVPTLMHTGVVPGPLGDDRRANTANGQQAQENGGGDQGNAGIGDPMGKDPRTGASPDGRRQGEASTAPSQGSAESPGANDDLAVTSPRCERDQLGQATVQVDDPDDRGHIYGSFRFVNVYADPCRIKGTDELTATARGEADATAIQILDHTEGGKAERLPSPGEARDDLILRPGEAYQVRFAWLPDKNRGPGGCRPDPSPDPGPSDEPDGSGDGSDGGNGSDGGDGGDGGGGDEPDGTGVSGSEAENETQGTTAQSSEESGSGMSTLADTGTGSGGDDGDSGDSAGTAVVLRYTPAAGEPRAPRAFLNGVCAGTIYRTGALPAP